MTKTVNIVWLEQDLRLSDNPALLKATENADVLAIYVLDDANAGEWAMGAASRWWLHHSLVSLNAALGGCLNVYRGDPALVIAELCQRFNVTGVYWNRRYEPWRIARDKDLKAQLRNAAIATQSFNGSLLHEPWQVLKGDASAYKVFTPYDRQASKQDSVPAPHALPVPKRLPRIVDPAAITIDALALLPKISWDAQFYDSWAPGEEGAHCRLHAFLDESIGHYKNGRDFPALKAVSKLSPHIHFGEISPTQIVAALQHAPQDNNSEHFKRELRWREFAHHLLYHWPNIATDNLKSNFDAFPWQHNTDYLRRWQRGETGYPMVDAGMRELWQTGFMHNRVRMIVASFLVKNLLVDWRQGARWFWDCLVDADLANNSASWQWVAGCGTDAAPYFRIFNPVSQGQKFDPGGDYIRQYIPELNELPTKYLFEPWSAPAAVLEQANIVLGKTYPLPIVDIKASRQAALDAYAQIKRG